MRYDTQYNMTEASCEVCGSSPSIHVSLLNSYPARICELCRREFQAYIMNSVDYKALCGAYSSPELEGPERFNLLYDIQKGMYPLVAEWFNHKGVTYGIKQTRTGSTSTTHSFSISLAGFKTTFEWCRVKPEKVP